MKKLTFILVIFLTGEISGETIIVDQAGNGDYTTIQAGIGATNAEGDTVLVLPGVYIEGVSINVDWKIYLVGSGVEVTTIFYANRALVTNNHGHEISGFNIQSTQATTVALTSNSKLKHCIVEGFGDRQTSGSSNYPAIAISGGNITISNTVIQSAGYGIYSISNSYNAVVNNCIFYNNYYGVYIDGGTLTIQNSIFENNVYATLKQNGYLSTIYSCFNNNNNDFSGTSKGIGDITVDPKFDDISKSFVLKSDSPARDAGNPSSGYNDGDGSRNDMGVYGGPYSWGKGPVVTEISISPSKIDQGGTVTINATAKKH